MHIRKMYNILLIGKLLLYSSVCLLVLNDAKSVTGDSDWSITFNLIKVMVKSELKDLSEDLKTDIKRIDDRCANLEQYITDLKAVRTEAIVGLEDRINEFEKFVTENCQLLSNNINDLKHLVDINSEQNNVTGVHVKQLNCSMENIRMAEAWANGKNASCPSTPCKCGATCFDSHYGSKYRCLFNEIMDTDTHGDLPKDCLEIIEHPEKFTNKGDGVYKIRTWRSQTVLNVFCNMTFAQGGWTVLQRRDMNNFPVLDFNRSFSEYEYGFGNPSSEYWLGLRYASELSSYAKDNCVSAELTDSDGQVIRDVAENVTLNDGPGYNFVIQDSRIQDSRLKTRDGSSLQMFSSNRFYTYDQDSLFNCAAADDGGWWFKDDYSYCFSNDTFRQMRPQDTAHDFLSLVNCNGRRLVSHPHTIYNLDSNDVLKERTNTVISTLFMIKRM